MPLTSGSLALGTKLYSLTVVMPELSGFSAAPPSSLSSSLEKTPALSGEAVELYRQIARPTSAATTTNTAAKNAGFGCPFAIFFGAPLRTHTQARRPRERAAGGGATR